MSVLRYRDHAFRSILRANGPDARDFLQGQFSQDLSRLPAGGVVYGLWLDRKGKIVADSFVCCLDEETFLVASYYCEADTLLRRLDAYLIMEEVELSVVAEAGAGLCVCGLEGGESIAGMPEIELPELGSFLRNGDVLVFWGRRGSMRCLELLGTSEEAGSQLNELAAQLEAAGAGCLEEAALFRAAIEGSVATVGRGFGESDLPQELGLEGDAVSFNKGCYLGQEVMARLRSMGRARKRLAKVRIESSNTIKEDALPLALIDASGKKQGELRLAAFVGSEQMGLAVLSTRFEGSELQGEGVVVALSE